MESYIDSPSQLLKDVWGDPNVHIVQKKKRLAKYNFTLIDISLKAHGKDEDQSYINSLFYRQNIRRGNTLIQYSILFIDSDREIQWARKGTPKIMDMQLKYLHSYSQAIQLKQSQRRIRDIIFRDVLASLKLGNKIQIIKTEKANGQNAQVSYNYNVNAWVICSKNVSLLALYAQDLKQYRQQRYQYALMIAEEWFNILKKLKKHQIQQLKSRLDGYTIIGEYCGNPLYQHLISYEKTHLRWFALVKNNSDMYCTDPFYLKKQFQQFGLQFVRMKAIGTFTNFDKFIGCLEQLYLKTSSAGIQDKNYGQQGSIVYFIQINNRKHSSITVGATKLKTLQYRYLRKIRQKIARFNINKQNKEQIVKKYLNQCKDLSIQTKTTAPFPMSHYQKVIETALEITSINNLDTTFIRGRFVTFLKFLYYLIFKKINLKKYSEFMFSDQQFMTNINSFTFQEYGCLNSNMNIIYFSLGLPGMFKTYLGNKISEHFKKIVIKYHKISIDNLNKIQIISETITNRIKQISNPQQINKNNNQLNIFYIDGCLDPHQLLEVTDAIKEHKNRDVYYKFIVIKNQNIQKFKDKQNQYPFNIEQIIMSYYGQHQKKLKANKIIQKVQNLRLVTKALNKCVNFDQFGCNITTLSISLTKNFNIPNLKQFNDIINQIIQSDSQKSYHKLILRIEQIKTVSFLDEKQIQEQIITLIKNSFSFVPTVNFRYNNNTIKG